MADYKKDYTALLLNCYVKREYYEKIELLVTKITQKEFADAVSLLKGKKIDSPFVDADPKKIIFDEATAIEVCRQ